MNMAFKKCSCLFFSLFFLFNNFSLKAKLIGYAQDCDCLYELSGILKEEMFYGKNLSLLNNYMTLIAYFTGGIF